MTKSAGTAFVAAASVVCAPAQVHASTYASAPIPQITFQGQNVTNSGTPTTVAIGQQITLSADQVGATRSWVVDQKAGTYGSFAAYDSPPKCADFPDVSTQPCVVYKQASFSTPQTTFYIVNPGTFNVTYTYTKSDGATASSSTTFKVEAPRSVSVSFQLGSIQIVPAGCTSQCYLAFGNPATIPTVPGITMTASAKEPKNIPGRFQWSQYVTKVIDFYIGNILYACPTEYGLDNMFPYARGDVATDAPNILLEPEQFIVEENFGAQTTLLWQAKTSSFVLGSTPVALGDASWSWAADALQIQPGSWILDSSYVGPATFIAYSSPSLLAPWQSVLLNTYNPSCQPFQ